MTVLSNVWPGIVIVEGIMGSGKSTTVLRIADHMNASGIPSVGITEGVSPHPIRFDWDTPWVDMPPAQLATSAVGRWREYASSTSTSESISVVDGQLFHGNLTSLFLLDADRSLILEYVNDIVAAVTPLRPLLIYFHQDDVGQAIRTIAAERGNAWVRYQVHWKLRSPYAVRHSLNGLEGLIDLYRNDRHLTDRLYTGLEIPKISIETSGRDWATYEKIIHRILMSQNAILEAPTSLPFQGS
ncbi:MAG: hypothetical protein ACKVP3_02930 [Hyphomicrobiaceae bacterium]